MLALLHMPAHLLAVRDQADSNGLSGLLYVMSMELTAGLPVLPQSSTGRALLIAALKGMRLPNLAAADVAVTLDSTAGNGTAAVYAFSPSQPGIYLIAVCAAPLVSLAVYKITKHFTHCALAVVQVTSPQDYTGQVGVSLPNILGIAPLVYMVAGPSTALQARATAWRLSHL